jgi:hypothetical protein
VSDNPPRSINPPPNFAFTLNPGPATTDFPVDILVPDNGQKQSSYTIMGTFPRTATLVSVDWTSRNLETLLGIFATFNSPIGASRTSAGLDPGVTGFSVFRLDAGTQTLQDTMSPFVNLTTIAPIGSYTIGFLSEDTVTSPDGVAGANSNTIFEGKGATTMPEPSFIILLGSVTLGVATLVKRTLVKKKVQSRT